MIKRNRTATILAGAIAAALAFAGCSSSGGKGEQSGTGAADTERIKIAMITHGQPGDTFWDQIRQGANAAASKDNVELIYRNSPDSSKQATFVRNAIDQQVDGIAVTLAAPDAMRGAVKEAQKAGIPVVAFNQGLSDWKSQGIGSYFGQDPSLAGNEFGNRLNEVGAKHQLCVIQDPSVALDARCNGVKETFKGKSTRLHVNGEDKSAMLSRITAKLQQDSSIDYVTTLGAPVALVADKAVNNSGSKAKVATFDINKEVIQAIKSGKVQWAIDQQPYLQGYLAVDSLWLAEHSGTTIGGGQPVLTGPSVVDKENVDTVTQSSGDGN